MPAREGNKEAAPILSASYILNIDDRPVTPVPVPEWGGTVLCRPLSLAEQDGYRKAVEAAEKDDDDDEVRATIVEYLLLVLVNEDKRALFERKDLGELQTKCGAVLQRLFEDCVSVNGLSRDAVEDAEKN